MRSTFMGLCVAGLFVVGFGLVGCSDDGSDDNGSGPTAYSIVGLWETDFPDTVSTDLFYNEFRADGSFHYGTEVIPLMQVGTWSQSGDTITMNVTVPSAVTLQSTVAFSSNSAMALTPLGGGTATPYVRVVQ